MAWRGLSAVLAFAIRHRVTPTGKAFSVLERPRLTSQTDRATALNVPISSAVPMTKRQPKIDTRNPFIPSHSPVCRAADTVLLFSVALFGCMAGVAALLRQVL